MNLDLVWSVGCEVISVSSIFTLSNIKYDFFFHFFFPISSSLRTKQGFQLVMSCVYRYPMLITSIVRTFKDIPFDF